jgi:hypothetical protein
MLSDLGLHMRAGDEKRTRTVSLGMSAGHPVTSMTAGRRWLALSVSVRRMRGLPGRSGTQRARPVRHDYLICRSGVIRPQSGQPEPAAAAYLSSVRMALERVLSQASHYAAAGEV